MHSIELLHLRHHLIRPEGLSLQCWAVQLDTLRSDTALLEDSLQEHRQMRRLDRELNAVRQEAPHLEGPALADAVLHLDRSLQWALKACRSELEDHRRVLQAIAARFDLPTLHSLAADEFAGHARLFECALGPVSGALARPSGSVDADEQAAVNAGLEAARLSWRAMHDTVDGVLRLLDHLDGEAGAPRLVGWASDRLKDLRALQARLQQVDAFVTRWSRPS